MENKNTTLRNDTSEVTITTVDGLVLKIGRISDDEEVQKAFEEVMRQYGSAFKKLAGL